MALRRCRVLGGKYQSLLGGLFLFSMTACASVEDFSQKVHDLLPLYLQMIEESFSKELETSSAPTTFHPVPSLLLPNENDSNQIKSQVVVLSREEIIARIKRSKPISIIDSQTSGSRSRQLGHRSFEGDLGGKVFFQPRLSDLTSKDIQTLSKIIVQYHMNNKNLHIIGLVPLGSGNTLSEIELAWRRISMVREILINEKIPESAIKIETAATSDADGGVEIYFQY